MKDTSLPPSFSRRPSGDIHHYFRNLLLEFKKIIHNTQNIDDLESQMETIINAAKDYPWHEHPSSVFKKSEAEKLLDKLFDEFKRYIDEIQKDLLSANSEDLLFALEEVMEIFSQR